MKLKAWTVAEMSDPRNWDFRGVTTLLVNSGNGKVTLREAWQHEMLRELGSGEGPRYDFTTKRTSYAKAAKLAHLTITPTRLAQNWLGGGFQKTTLKEKLQLEKHIGVNFGPVNGIFELRLDLGADKDALRRAFEIWLRSPEFQAMRERIGKPPPSGRGEDYVARFQALGIYRLRKSGHANSNIRKLLKVGTTTKLDRAERDTESAIRSYKADIEELTNNTPGVLLA